RRFPGVSFLQLDAHADLRASYEGTPYSHACIGRRLTELGPLVQVGIRSLTREENDWIKKGPVKTFFAHRLKEGASGAWQDEVVRSLTSEVYVTIDLDVFDPSIMPAVGTPEPGGLDWTEVTGLLRRISRTKTIVGFDVVELAPIPGLIAPDFLAAKLTYRLIGEVFQAPPRDRHILSPKET
ncbi:MAG TPA: arginase family protein, partial [Thermodesulfobacteriota bacterium]|nr:arginase family protein [Thermodesulfobacteriota bacterium]